RLSQLPVAFIEIAADQIAEKAPRGRADDCAPDAIVRTADGSARDGACSGADNGARTLLVAGPARRGQQRNNQDGGKLSGSSHRFPLRPSTNPAPGKRLSEFKRRTASLKDNNSGQNACDLGKIREFRLLAVRAWRASPLPATARARSGLYIDVRDRRRSRGQAPSPACSHRAFAPASPPFCAAPRSILDRHRR